MHAFIVAGWRRSSGLVAMSLAIALSYGLASVAHTQTVLRSLTALDVQVPALDRLTMTAGDLVGLWRYGALIAIAMAVALLIATRLARRFDVIGNTAWHVLAGTTGIAALLLALQLTLPFTLLASAREWPGIVLQCAAGAVGGWLYAWIRSRQPSRTDDCAQAGQSLHRRA